MAKRAEYGIPPDGLKFWLSEAEESALGRLSLISFIYKIAIITLSVSKSVKRVKYVNPSSAYIFLKLDDTKKGNSIVEFFTPYKSRKRNWIEELEAVN